jgi:hypothetical protein
MSGLRNVPRFTAIGGGGSRRVLRRRHRRSGAPAATRIMCASAGIQAISEELELQ